jgi:hypothetical protein
MDAKVPKELDEYRMMCTLNQRGTIPFIIGRLGHKLISEEEIKMKINESEYLFDERLPTPANVETMVMERKPLTEEVISEFLSKWRNNSVLLRFMYHERYYDREKVELFLRSTHPMRVIIPMGCADDPDVDTRESETRLEKDRETEALWRWVQSNPPNMESMPRALIRDDLPLLRDNPKLLELPRVLIVSDDVKMVQQLSNLRSFNWRSSKQTFRCSVKDWVDADLTAGQHFNATDEVIVDIGSLDGYIDNVENDSDLDPKRHGILLSSIETIRPTRSHKIQEVSEYDSMLSILKELGSDD